MFLLQKCFYVEDRPAAHTASKVPAYLNVVDIAGLVKGAHEGQVCRVAL